MSNVASLDAQMRVPLSIGAVHFIGIGGIGMSGIAEVMKELGNDDPAALRKARGSTGGHRSRCSGQGIEAGVEAVEDEGLHGNVGLP